MIAKNGALERTRTSDLQVRNLLLYPLSYERVRFNFTRVGGGTCGFGVQGSGFMVDTGAKKFSGPDWTPNPKPESPNPEQA